MAKSVVDQETGEIIDVKSWEDIVSAESPDLSEFLSTEQILLQVEAKKSLINTPFYIVGWKWSTSKKFTNSGGTPVEFANILCAISKNGKTVDRYFVINDGSTGIAATLKRWEADGRRGNIFCSKGLKASEYEVEVGDNLTTGTTFYIA